MSLYGYNGIHTWVLNADQVAAGNISRQKYEETFSTDIISSVGRDPWPIINESQIMKLHWWQPLNDFGNDFGALVSLIQPS